MHKYDYRIKNAKRGISLIEVMVSMSISTAVIALAFSGLSTVTSLSNSLKQSALADNESRMLEEYLTTLLMMAGGGPIKPWMGFAIENNNGTYGSDRITVALQGDASLQLSILSYNTTYINIDNTFGCALTSQYDKKQIIIVTGSTDEYAHWASLYVTSINLALCRIYITAGQGTALNTWPTSTSSWIGGTIAVANLYTIWLDQRTLELKIDQDTNGDALPETLVLSDRVYDIQAAAGYDTTPWDWHVSDLGSNNDEWLYNATGDTIGQNDGQGLANANPEELRMVRVAVMVGAPGQEYLSPPPVQVLDGANRGTAGWILRTTVSTAGFRNYDIMRQ